MPQCCCVKGSITRKFLYQLVRLTIYITRQNLLLQAVKDVKLQFKTLKLGNSIPRGRLQVRVYYTAFIRSSIKKYNFIKKDKDIVNFIKREKENKEGQWTMDPKSAVYFIITTL